MTKREQQRLARQIKRDVDYCREEIKVAESEIVEYNADIIMLQDRCPHLNTTSFNSHAYCYITCTDCGKVTVLVKKFGEYARLNFPENTQNAESK